MSKNKKSFRVLKETINIINKQCFPVKVPNASIALTVLVKISEILCFHRVQIQSPLKVDHDQFPMLYGMTFMSSGEGKDRPKLILDKILMDISITNNDLVNERIERIKEDVIKDSKNKSTKALQRIYVDEHRVRPVLYSFNRGTVEGMQTERQSYERIGFGCLSYVNSEIADAIIGQDKTTEEVLNEHKEIYDAGNSKTKLIKGANNLTHVKGVPQIMHVYSAPEPLFETPKATESLFKMLSSGLARRSFICYPKKSEKKEKIVSYEDYIKMQDHDSDPEIFIENKFRLMNKAVTATGIHRDGPDEIVPKKIKLSIEAHKAEYEFILENHKESKLIQDSTIAVEVKNRHFKCRRLAGCVAAYEHPDDLTITENDYRVAIMLTRKFSEHFQRFFKDKKGMTNGDIIYKHLTTNKKATKTDLRKIIQGRNEYKTRLLNDALVEAEEIANSNDKKIIQITDKFSTHYTLQGEFVEKNDAGNMMCTVSIGDSNLDSCVNFEVKRVRFKNVFKAVYGKNRYTPAIFKGTRKKANWIGGDTIMMFDVDNDDPKYNLSMESVKEIFEGYRFAMFTTKRHMTKEGNMKERYRILFPVESISGITAEEYATMKENFLKHFNIANEVELKACLDCSKMWFPHKGEMYMSEGNKLINWKIFNTKKKETKKSTKKFVYKGTKKNVREGQTFKLPTGENVGWEHFEGKSGTTPVHCTELNHEDKKASAFVATHQDSGNLFFCCNGCDLKYFNK